MDEIAIEAPITGLVVDICVAVGDEVGVGDMVAVIESMKMENEILCEYSGVVKEIVARPRQHIAQDDTLLTLTLG